MQCSIHKPKNMFPTYKVGPYPVISRVITPLIALHVSVSMFVFWLKKYGGHSFASPESQSQETLDPLIESSDSNLSLSSTQMSQIESHHVQ